MPPGERVHRKDLQDLRYLPRSAFLSYLQKQAQPKVPRPRDLAAKPTRYPKLAAFLPQRVWKWISQYLRYRIGRKHPFQHYDPQSGDNGVYRLASTENEIRIVLAGDWGTGTDEAASVAKRMEECKPHYSIHLGDVYYVGSMAEVGENFLGIANPANQYRPCKWPPGSEGTFALNSNHEMYARGFGYFDGILPTLGLRGAPNGQRASYFCLENDHWRIVALDTGYHSIGLPILEYVCQPDCRLPEELVDWLRTVVQPRPDDPRGIVILSHHQYYSRFDICIPNAAQQLAEFFSRPVLWFWGHEHRLAIYQEAQIGSGISAFGRCIGHGGMPVDLDTPVKNADYITEFVDDRVYTGDENLHVGFNGFVKMTLVANRLTLDYIDLNNIRVFQEIWTVDGGLFTRVAAP
jgi:hypothetical protein